MDLVELMLKNLLLFIYQAKIIHVIVRLGVHVENFSMALYPPFISIPVLQDQNSQMCRHSNLEYNKSVHSIYKKL